jgi:pyridoxal biosynthesis lyase PdxS
MKQKDIALILVVVAVSGVISFFVASGIFTSKNDRAMQAEVVQPVTPDFSQPSNKYFNANSIDPTQQIHIGDGQNTAPFNGKQ